MLLLFSPFLCENMALLLTPLARPTTFPARLTGLALLGLTLLLNACSQETEPPTPAAPTAETYSADVATKWTDLELRLIKNGTGFTPPVASRALGYVGVTLYEAVVPGMAAHKSLAGQ